MGSILQEMGLKVHTYDTMPAVAREAMAMAWAWQGGLAPPQSWRAEAGLCNQLGPTTNTGAASGGSYHFADLRSIKQALWTRSSLKFGLYSNPYSA